MKIATDYYRSGVAVVWRTVPTLGRELQRGVKLCKLVFYPTIKSKFFHYTFLNT
jgi:hypothetical protein